MDVSNTQLLIQAVLRAGSMPVRRQRLVMKLHSSTGGNFFVWGALPQVCSDRAKVLAVFLSITDHTMVKQRPCACR